MFVHILLSLSSLFDSIMVASIEASVLIVLIVLVQYVCKRHLGIRWHYALWFVLVAKLSLLWMPDRILRSFEWLSVGDQLHITKLIESTRSVVPFIHTMAGQSVDTSGAVQIMPTPISLLFTWTNMAAMIWLLGMVFMVTRIWILHRRQASQLKDERMPSVPDEVQHIFNQMLVKLRVKRTLLLRQTNLVSSPSLFGLFKPMVLLPAYMLEQMSDDELTYVIAHELSHYKRRDILVNTWCASLAIVHWFNPIVWYGFYRMRIDQELACDARTIDYIGHEQKTKYATTLIKLIELGNCSRVLTTQLGLLGYRNQIKRRIMMIQSLNRRKYRNSIIGILAALLLVAIALPQSQIGQARTIDNFVIVHPTEGSITTHYGWMNKGSNGNKKVFHDGIDIQNNEGTPIKAVAAGTITAAEYDPNRGNTITIVHNEQWITRYDHLLQIDVEVGSVIKQAEQIGLMGSTGASTGPHLHFAIMNNEKYVDPKSLLKFDH